MPYELTPFAHFALLDQLPCPVFVLEPDAKGRPVYVAFNAHARAQSKRPLGDYLGRTAREVYTAAYGRTAYLRHCEVLRTGHAMSYQLELPLQGKRRTIRTNLQPEVDAEGRVLRLFGNSVDITLENSAREANVGYQTIASEMEQFVAMAAHDLRAPMRNITTITDLLREDYVDLGDGKLELINLIDDVAKKSMDLVADVLSHARALSTEKDRSKFSFQALCRDVCDVLDPEGKHWFRISPAQVVADRTTMQIALRNIIDNAIKHNKAEQLVMDIRVRPDPSGMLDITLSDNGGGFSRGALEMLNQGTLHVDSGYGLFGIKRLVAARGGAIVAENAADNSGAILHVTLPGEWVERHHSIGDALPEVPVVDQSGDPIILPSYKH